MISDLRAYLDRRSSLIHAHALILIIGINIRTHIHIGAFHIWMLSLAPHRDFIRIRGVDCDVLGRIFIGHMIHRVCGFAMV